jgi:hypothetical protein
MDRRKFLKWGSSIIPIAGALPSVALELPLPLNYNQ